MCVNGWRTLTVTASSCKCWTDDFHFEMTLVVRFAEGSVTFIPEYENKTRIENILPIYWR